MYAIKQCRLLAVDTMDLFWNSHLKTRAQKKLLVAVVEGEVTTYKKPTP